MKCDLCGKDQKGHIEHAWRLRDYYGISGLLCGRCYERVRHDAYGRPYRPVMYCKALEKLESAK